MLSDPDPDVVMEAVGVLVALREQKAALPLIRLARGRDQIFLLQIITALGEIQGPVARGFLFTVAAGHDSPEIRERAREALDRVVQADRPATSTSPEPAVAYPRGRSDGSKGNP
jgi:HEAT repeat protein